MRKLLGGVAIVAAILLSASIAPAASAAPGPPIKLGENTFGEVEYDVQCVARVKGQVDKIYCASQSFSTSVEQVVALGEIPVEDLSLRSPEGVSLGSVVAAGTVTRKQWEQGKQSAIGAWRTSQTGTTYYNGSYVWTKGAYGGLTGTHVCNVGGWGVGYSITTTSCTESNTWTSSPITHRYYFRVSAVVSGFPVYVDDFVIRTISRTGAES